MTTMINMCFSLLVLLPLLYAGCQGKDVVTLRNRTGVITSPHYPSPYPNNADVIWELSSASPMRFTFNLTSFDIEESNQCKADNLTIREKPLRNVTPGYKAMVCGSMDKFPNKSFVWPLVVYGVEVSFNTDGTVSGKGFRLEYDSEYVDEEILCKNMRERTAYGGIISNEYLGDASRFPAKLNCSWELKAPSGYGISVKVNRFDIEYYGENCDKDSLRIFKTDSAKDEEELLHTFCGRRRPWEMELRDVRTLRLNLVTDDSDNSGGFHITYSYYNFSQTIFKAEQVYKRIYGKANGEFPLQSKGSPILGQITLFSWHFRAEPGFRIRIKAHLQPDVSSSKVPTMFYDAPSDTFNDRYYYDLTTTSIDVKTDGFHAVFEFTLSNMSLFQYINLTYESFNNFLSEDLHFEFLGIGDYSFSISGHPAFRCCYYHALTVPHHKAIAFNLKRTEQFRNQPTDDECSHAGMVVYDGGFAADQMIGPVCETTPNRLFELFDNFVSRSPKIYVFLYGYAGGLEKDSTLFDSWPTTCAAQHITGYSLATQSPGVSIHASLNFSVSSRYGPDDCFLLYVYPAADAEPPLQFLIENNGTAGRLCEAWNQVTTSRGVGESDSILPVPSTKYSHQWSCDRLPNVTKTGKSVFYLYGNEKVTWSQRVVRLGVGDVGIHLCPEVPKCQIYLVPPNTCGTIVHSGDTCTWRIRDTDNRQFYWTFEILYLEKYAQDKLADGCYLSLEEDLWKTQMTTRFLCIDINFEKLTRYRTMCANSPVVLTNRLTSYIKLRYAKKYNNQTSVNPGQGELNAVCSGNSVQYNGFCYDFQRIWGQFSWMEAEDACVRKGGHLVSFTNTHELDFLKQTLLSNWNDSLYVAPLGLIFIGLSDVEQPAVYRWTDGNPPSVADWFHAWDKDYNILPHSPKLPIDPTLSQPDPEKSKRCVAMAVANAYFSTNWRKINCFQRYHNTSYMCKWPRDNTTNNVTTGVQWKTTSPYTTESNQSDTAAFQTNSTRSAVDSNVMACLENWTFIQGKCYCLISPDINIGQNVPSRKASGLCVEAGGQIASGKDNLTETLLYYFKLWGVNPGDGNVWLRDEQGQLGCTSVSTLSQKLDGFYDNNSSTCVIDEGSIHFVLCESQAVPLSTTCLGHQFRCHDGTCLEPTRLCNRQYDCLGGEDEYRCSDSGPDLFFSCTDGAFISVSDVCDFWPDCRDGSDENGCHHRACLSEEFRCGNRQCIPSEKKCDFVNDCLDRSDEEACDWGVEICRGFECPGGTCIPFGRVTDLVPDCPDGTQADEESSTHKRLAFYDFRNDLWTVEYDLSPPCPKEKLSRRCHWDRATCMNRANVCQYDQNEQGDILYCRDGTHLKNCERYECPGMFKCPKSYCIPWYKVCDRQWDCVGGVDEVNCDQYSCPGKLKCKGTHQCVTREQVCDGRVHCKDSWSDEQFCDLLGWSCPSRCSCDGYAVDCSAANLTEIPYLLTSTRVLLLQENRIKLVNSSFHRFSYLLTLRLYSNDIGFIPNNTFSQLYNLQTLDLRFNSITSLYANVFNGLTSLVHLLLGGNTLEILPSQAFVGLNSIVSLNLSRLGIWKVERNAFNGLSNLKQLDLSKNQISVLESGSMPDSAHIEMLHLTGNSLDGTPAEVFRQVVAETLWTDSFRFCCYVETSQVDECYPNTDVFSSCEDLLSTVVLRAFVWFWGIACVLGNTIVIVWRMYSGFPNRPSVYVLNLSVSDTLMGVYLIILASMDIFYRGNYILSDLDWRQGSFCQFLGILTTVSCEMSMFTLLVLAIDRFLSVKFPFTLSLHTGRGAWILMACLWSFSLILALVPIALPAEFEKFYGKNSICMPFSFTDPKRGGWEYATVVFVGLNSACLAAMIGLYAAIYCRVRESQMTAGRRDRSDLVVARRLSIVLVTNIISWIPVILASIISITVGPLTREMAAILSTVVLPLNPALNPYLYTFSTCVKGEDNTVQKTTSSEVKKI